MKNFLARTVQARVVLIGVVCPILFLVPLFGAEPKLEVRGITIGMTHSEIESAAAASGMHIIEDASASGHMAVYADPHASGRAVGGAHQSSGHGLVLRIRFEDGKSSYIVVQEQEDVNGEVGEDLAKKWGQPKSSTSNPHNSLPWWGDPNGVWADFQSQPVGVFGCSVTIHGPSKPAKPRQGVKM